MTHPRGSQWSKSCTESRVKGILFLTRCPKTVETRRVGALGTQVSTETLSSRRVDQVSWVKEVKGGGLPEMKRLSFSGTTSLLASKLGDIEGSG